MSFLKNLFSKPKAPVELPPEFLQSNPPDWLIEMKGHDVADDRRFSVRVELQNESREGVAHVVVLPAKEGEEPKSASGPLDRPEVDRLFVILGFSFPDDIHNIAADGAEGIPVSVSVHKHEPYELKTGECDLADWTDSRRARPAVVDVGMVLWELLKRLGGC